MTNLAAYADLEQRFRQRALYGDALMLLHWDMSVNMPRGGAAARTEQMAALGVLQHELLTAPEIGDLLDAAEADDAGLNAWQRANLREMRRDWLHATALDGDFVEAYTRACSACEMAWREARPANDFKAVQPHLQKVLDLSRQAGEAKADALGVPLYDALLDQFEPGGQAERIDALFADLADWLPDTISRVIDRQAANPPQMPEGPFPVEAQRRLGERLMRAIGFDFEHGRLDLSAHPFSSGVPEDQRITTRFDEADFTSGLMGVLHETGHAMYEAGRPAAWRWQPVGECRSLTLHESQSLIIEMQACRSRAFLSWAVSQMREIFGGEGRAWELDNMHRLYTQVERGFIRVDADEVTYPAHVILRYRLERAMLQGDLALADLPGAWNDGMRELLGVTPPDDRLGCLQDIHWMDGAWGYFPTYTMGAIAAAQLFSAAKEQAGDVEAALAEGDFGPLRDWLRTHVHALASRDGADAVLETATGRPLDVAAFKQHIEHRYLADI